MDLKKKVAEALRRQLQALHIELKDEDGVFGIIVSPDFQQKPALERQLMIQKALRAPDAKISVKERSRVFTIAGLTPAEYVEIESRTPRPARRTVRKS